MKRRPIALALLTLAACQSSPPPPSVAPSAPAAHPDDLVLIAATEERDAEPAGSIAMREPASQA